MGGRENITTILASQPRDTKQDILFRLLSDPSRVGDSLQTLCQDAGLSATDLFQVYHSAVSAQAMVRAQTTLAEKLQGVVQDVAEKAADHVKPCHCAVLSATKMPDPECPDCRGRGEVYREGSLKHAEVVLKATDMLKSGGGVNVAVNQQMGVNVGGGLLDSFVKATDDAAFDVIDAKEVEPEAN